MAKKKTLKLNKFERLLLTFTIILVLSFPIVCLFSKSTLSKINYENEKIKSKIEVEEKENIALEMKINELASLENLEAIAKEMGLSYNNSSVKVIEE